jgi:transposase-like protein
MARSSSWKNQERWSAADARAIIEEQERSGLSVWLFAEKHGVVAERLYWWRRKLRPGNGSVQFVEVQSEGGRRESAPIEIVLRGGHRVLVRGAVDVDALRDIVVALEG